MFKVVKNNKGNICQAYRCKNHKVTNSKYCSKHKHKAHKENNLLGYTYSLLKQNAKRRNKVFTITIDDFRDFCNETGYLELKGKNKNSASIDRINPLLGV